MKPTQHYLDKIQYHLNAIMYDDETDVSSALDKIIMNAVKARRARVKVSVIMVGREQDDRD